MLTSARTWRDRILPHSLKGAVGRTLLFVFVPGVAIEMIMPWSDGKWAWVYLAGLTVVMGSVSVTLFNAHEIRGIGKTMLAAILPVMIAGFASIVYLSIYGPVFGMMIGVPLSLVSGLAAYAVIGTVKENAERTHSGSITNR